MQNVSQALLNETDKFDEIIRQLDNLIEVQKRVTNDLKYTQTSLDKIKGIAHDIVTSLPELHSENQTINYLKGKWKDFSTYANTTLQIFNTPHIDTVQSKFENYIEWTKLILYCIGAFLVLMLAGFIGLLVNSNKYAFRIHFRSEKALCSGTGKWGHCMIYSLYFLFLLLIVAVSVAIGISLFGFSVMLGKIILFQKTTVFERTVFIIRTIAYR